MAGFLCETWEVVLAFWASSPARGHRSLTNVLAALTGSLGHWVATRPGSSLVLFRVYAHFHLFGSAPPSLYGAPGCALPSHLAPHIPRYRAGHLAGAQCLSKRTLSWSKPGCPYLNYFICNRRLLKVFWKLWTPFPWKMHRLTCLKCACISGCGSWRPIGGPKSWPLASHAAQPKRHGWYSGCPLCAWHTLSASFLLSITKGEVLLFSPFSEGGNWGFSGAGEVK